MPPPLTKIQGSEVQLEQVQGQPSSLMFMPRNFAELDTFAERMAASKFVPPHLRGRPADCFAVALQALRWQMDPYAVASQTYFPKADGAPAYMAQLVNAIVHARAPLEGRLKIVFAGDWKDNSRTCTVSGKLRGDDDIKARTVHAVNITTRNSPLWKTDPDQQLGYYSQRAWAKLFVPDVLMGIYTPDDEEMHAERARDITPAEERPQPTSRLDALESVIDAETSQEEVAAPYGGMTPPDKPTPRTDYDPETGEVRIDGVLQDNPDAEKIKAHQAAISRPLMDDPKIRERIEKLGAEVLNNVEPDIFPPSELPPPSAEEVERAEAWANKAIAKIDTITEIDGWLERNKDALAQTNRIAPEAAMAVVAAADMRKKQLEGCA